MGGGRAKLTKAKLQEIPFAVPPLRVQARIVEILDKFTQMEAELEARNKQYDFYRNRLLTGPLPHSPNIPHQWEQVPLGSIGEVRMCKRILKRDTTETGKIPFYKNRNFRKISRRFYLPYLVRRIQTKICLSPNWRHSHFCKWHNRKSH